MNKLIEDLWLNIQDYYADLVQLIPKLFLAIIVFSFLYFLANRVRNFVKKSLTKRMDDPLLATFLSQAVKIFLVIVAGLVALQILGLSDIAGGIITGASVSAVVFGFAFKDIGENFLAGILLAFNRPFRVGDIVELDGYKGTVVSLSLRNSRIKTFDGKDIFISNASVVKNPLINYTMDGFLRNDFKVGIDYGADVNKAIKVILNTMKQIPGILQIEKHPNAFVSNLGNSSLEITVQYWLDTFDKGISGSAVKTQAIDEVLTNLDNAGFYMPSDIIELKNYKGEELLTVNKNDSNTSKLA